MEKLERVLSAEEDARSELDRAIEEAAGIRAAGAEDARRLEADIAAGAESEASRIREQAMAAARAEADRIADAAVAERAKAEAVAAKRQDAAVAGIVAMLQE